MRKQPKVKVEIIKTGNLETKDPYQLDTIARYYRLSILVEVKRGDWGRETYWVTANVSSEYGSIYFTLDYVNLEKHDDLKVINAALRKQWAKTGIEERIKAVDGQMVIDCLINSSGFVVGGYDERERIRATPTIERWRLEERDRRIAKAKEAIERIERQDERERLAANESAAA